MKETEARTHLERTFSVMSTLIILLNIFSPESWTYNQRLRFLLESLTFYSKTSFRDFPRVCRLQLLSQWPFIIWPFSSMAYMYTIQTVHVYILYMHACKVTHETTWSVQHAWTVLQACHTPRPELPICETFNTGMIDIGSNPSGIWQYSTSFHLTSCTLT